MVLFSPPPARNMKGISADVCCGNLVLFLEVKVTILRGAPMTGSLWRFNFQTCPYWASSSSSVTVCSSFPGTVSQGGFYSLGSLCSTKPQLSVFVCVSVLGGRDLLSFLPCFLDSSRVVDFSVFSVLCLLLRWSVYFRVTCRTRN